MRSINYVQLLGNVVDKPELKTYGGDKNLAVFTVATNVEYKDKNWDRISTATYHKCVCYITKLAIALNEYVNKGDAIIVEWSISNRSYEDANGVKKYITEINVTDFNRIWRIQKSTDRENDSYNDERISPSPSSTKSRNSYDEEEISIEDIPF